MAERLSAGVFIERREAGTTVIQAVSTSTFATAGFTQKGEVNKALLVTSLENFFDQFGGFVATTLLPCAMTAFFSNGGARAFVVRVVPDDAVTAKGDIATNWRFSGLGPGAFYNRIKVRLLGNENSKTVATATFTRFDLQILEESKDGEGDHVVIETFADLDLEDDNSASFLTTVVNDDSLNVRVEEIGAGAIPSEFDSTEIIGELIGTGDGSTQEFTDTLGSLPVAENTLKVKEAGAEVGVDNGTGKIIESGGSGVTGTIDYDTGEIDVFFSTPPAGAAAITVDYFNAGVSAIEVDLVGGSDGTFPLTRNNLTGPALVADKKGIFATSPILFCISWSMDEYSSFI